MRKQFVWRTGRLSVTHAAGLLVSYRPLAVSDVAVLEGLIEPPTASASEKPIMYVDGVGGVVDVVAPTTPSG